MRASVPVAHLAFLSAGRERRRAGSCRPRSTTARARLASCSGVQRDRLVGEALAEFDRVALAPRAEFGPGRKAIGGRRQAPHSGVVASDSDLPSDATSEAESFTNLPKLTPGLA
jgi:hypothetical protein